jgi:hypothetical protein
MTTRSVRALVGGRGLQVGEGVFAGTCWTVEDVRIVVELRRRSPVG